MRGTVQRAFAAAGFFLMLASPGRLPAGEDTRSSVQYSHQVWDANRGLTAFSINTIMQTPEGYIWLGTDEGLFRFDGVRFSQFSTANTPGIKHNNVTSLCLTQDSSLWIASNGGGLSRYRRGEFTAFSGEGGLPDKEILSIAAGPGGDLWIGTSTAGVKRMRNGSFSQVPSDSIWGDWLIYAVGADSDGAVYAGLSNRFVFMRHDGAPLRTIGKTVGLILSFCRLRDGTLLLGARDGVYLFDGASLRPFPVGEVAAIRSARSILEDHEGTLWFGTEGYGLYHYVQGTLHHLGPDDGILSDRILSLHEDAERNIWVGTRGGGLLRFRRSTVVVLSTTPEIPSGQISTVFERGDGELWVGTRDAGVSVIRGTTLVRRYTTEEGLAGNFIRCIFGDAGGNLWIASQEGLQVVHPGGGVGSVRRVTLQGAPLLSVRSCVQERDGTVWIGSSSDAVLVVRPGSLVPSRVPRTVPGTYVPVRTMLQDRDGRIWAGTRGGLARIEHDTLKPFIATNGVPLREIFSLHDDGRGALWIGTYGEGLFRLKDGALSRCTKQQGLFDDVIYTILDDGLGALWMSCNRGIFKVSERELNDFADGRIFSVSSISYGTGEGMQNVECNGGSQPAGWRMKDGRLMFPTMKGVALVRPGQVRETSRAPVPVIEEAVAGERTLRGPAEVRLEPGTRKFEALYTGLSLVVSERIEFRYMLEGFDEHWVEAGTARTASYTNLPPGGYVFMVAARHPGGDWTGQVATLRVTVEPHVWETAWFRSAVVATALLGIFLLARILATRALKRKLGELEAQRSLERERARISQDMHDEVGASLTQIAILTELLQRNIGEKEVATTYLKKISSTAQDVVESLDEIVWFINPKHDTLESLLFYIREHLTEFFESAEIACRFDIPESIAPLPLSADARRDIFMVVKEAATNIVKHAGATSVLVRMRAEEGVVEIRIEDNGKGMGEEHRSAFSNGIENMQRRMANIGGTCRIEPVGGGGTAVTIRGDARRSRAKAAS